MLKGKLTKRCERIVHTMATAATKTHNATPRETTAAALALAVELALATDMLVEDFVQWARDIYESESEDFVEAAS